MAIVSFFRAPPEDRLRRCVPGAGHIFLPPPRTIFGCTPTHFRLGIPDTFFRLREGVGVCKSCRPSHHENQNQDEKQAPVTNDDGIHLWHTRPPAAASNRSAHRLADIAGERHLVRTMGKEERFQVEHAFTQGWQGDCGRRRACPGVVRDLSSRGKAGILSGSTGCAGSLRGQAAWREFQKVEKRAMIQPTPAVMYPVIFLAIAGFFWSLAWFLCMLSHYLLGTPALG
jgi:hypothetical protein